MSKYAERFAENENDFSILPELTDQDLEKTLGYRHKILRAIACLDGAAQVVRGVSGPVTTPPPQNRPVAAPWQDGDRDCSPVHRASRDQPLTATGGGGGTHPWQ